jgi:two-component system sensor histidine kinase BarA
MKIPIKVLIVEDDLVNQKILCRYLSDYESIVVTDCGEDAVNKCESNVFDIVLMDIKLKNGIDGITTLKKIKEIGKYKDIPVIAVTGYAIKEDKEYFLQEGFDDYLAKPFVKETFSEFIKKYATCE